MRKSFLIVLILLLLAVCTVSSAETEVALDAISGKVTFNDDIYVVLTPSNLGEHPDLLSGIGKTQEELLADWNARGVQLQAWSKDKSVSVEMTVVQDDSSLRYFDLESQDRAGRNQYLKEQISSLRENGYLLDTSEMKLHSKSGHYVTCEYVLHGEDATHRGVIRRTVRNGYTFTINYEVYNRTLRGTDRDRSRKIVNAVVIETVAAPAASSGLQTQSAVDTEGLAGIPSNAADTLNLTVFPPEKTNSGTFTVEGTAYPGSEIIVVAMDYTKTTPGHPFSAVTGTNGKFKVKVTLPEEATYQIFINMYIGETCVADSYVNQITYSKFALPYSLDKPIPEQLTADELVISGTTDKGVTIQCIVTNGISTFDKTIRTNGTGKFNFKVNTKDEAEYDITLVFSKKNLSTERLNVKAARTLTAEDNKNRTASKAMKASYAALVKNLSSYIGQTMVYEAHIVKIEQIDDEWIITAALKLSKGTYSNFLYYMSKEDPGLAEGSRLKLYGTCVGPYQIQSEEGNESYPGFDYLFFE